MSFSLTWFVSKARTLLNSQVQLPVTLCASLNRLGWRSEAARCEIRPMENGEGYAMVPKREREKGQFFFGSPFFHTYCGVAYLLLGTLWHPHYTDKSGDMDFKGHTCLLTSPLGKGCLRGDRISSRRWRRGRQATGRKRGHSRRRGGQTKKGWPEVPGEEELPCGERETPRRISP